MVRGIRVTNLEASINIIHSIERQKNDFNAASQYLLGAIEYQAERNQLKGAVRQVHATKSHKKFDKDKPWMISNNQYGIAGTKEGKHGHHLKSFKTKEGGYTSSE